MHRDQKIGLSLAVLILGFAGAFCFRNEPLVDAHPLKLEQMATLDAQIEQLPIRAYTRREGADWLNRPAGQSARPGQSDRPGRADVPIAPVDQPNPPSGDIVDLFAGPPEPVVIEPMTTISPSEIAAPTGVDPAAQSPPAMLPEPPPSTGETPRGGPSADGPSPTLPAPAPPGFVLTPSTDNTPARTRQPPSREPTALAARRTYVVRPGDTLSGIAVQFYGSSRRYLELFDANRDVLASPNDLPLGTTLHIP